MDKVYKPGMSYTVGGYEICNKHFGKLAVICKS